MLEQKKLSQKLSNLVAGNRELKGQLLEAERFKDLVEKAMARIKALEQSIETMEKDIVDTRYILYRAVGRPENRGGGLWLCDGHNVPPVYIGLNDMSKYGAPNSPAYSPE